MFVRAKCFASSLIFIDYSWTVISYIFFLYSQSSAAKAPAAQVPSPYQPNWNSRATTGTPSPISPTPSPAGSVGSVGSVVSMNYMCNTWSWKFGSKRKTFLVVPLKIKPQSSNYIFYASMDIRHFHTVLQFQFVLGPCTSLGLAQCK